MPRAYLIRVGMDSTYGGFVSPIFPDNSYVFLPIPNVRQGGIQIDAHSDKLKTYFELKTNSGIPLTDYLPSDRLELNGRFVGDAKNLPTHNDPEFEGMTYGEKMRKLNGKMFKILKDFKEGDFIVFYATFYPCGFDFKYKDYTLSQLGELQKNQKQFHIFAFLKLKYSPITRSDYKQYEKEIKSNAHYLRGDFEKHNDSFVLKGTKDSGWIKPIRIDGFREGSNYMMNDFMSQFKLNDSRGLNRCYCEISGEIVPYLLKNKILK